ncbi:MULTISPECIES: glycosyltransferase family 2 protein [Reichenbachiella]|uniref:glycosyltransferase family 2 protein n=1 Tax=Reichenbachiella TaxID=156993 RepID=UPI000E6B947F|nr:MULTISPECIES: glycosyltransferase family 2 protein [Reichenbachiella]MBU2912400.1 glycosyltransferase family 2 protein [Reichenbachiella agariperforans]
MNTPKITVVVPIYNVSQYLTQCIDSIVNQTLSGLEVILVNDDSPDPQDDVICQDFANRYEHVLYVKHEKNKGLGGARNTGIEHATAEYITFIDSDDWLELNMFEELYNAAVKSDADIAQCFFYEHSEGNVRLQRVKGFRKQADIMHAINVLAWNKIYKTKLYKDNNVYFPEKIASQDVATMTRLLYFVDSVVLVRKGLYNYRINRKGSLTSNYKKLLTDLPVVFQIIQDFLEQHGKLESDKKFLEKRVLKSLVHHLNRMKKDTTIAESEKDALIAEHIQNSLKYLSLRGKDEIVNLDSAIKRLTRYRNKLYVRLFFA